MSTPVKYFHSDLPGAPTLNGVAGSLIAVLDACLVDGFGLKSADSVVVSGGIATATFSTGHSFEPDVIALVAGATPAGLNGEKRVLTTSTNTITFDATDIADGTATGTITVKVAPAGWDKAFSDGQVAVYRSTDAAGTRFYLRVDDSGANNARVVGYEEMTGASTGTGPFPTNAQVSGGGYWAKANNTSALARTWTICADSRSFSYFVNSVAGSGGASGSVWSFGDFESVSSADLFNCHLSCALAPSHTSTGTPQDSNDFLHVASSGGGVYVARSITGITGAIRPTLAASGLAYGSGATSGRGDGVTATYLKPGDDIFTVRKVLIEAGVGVRGVLRGEFYTPQNCHASLSRHQKLNGGGEMSGRKLLTLKCGGTAWTSSWGAMFLDITGPWGVGW